MKSFFLKNIRRFLHKHDVLLNKYSTRTNIDIYKKIFGSNIFETKNLYNIGAGSFAHPAWTNVDYYSDWYKKNSKNIGIHFDLLSLKNLPIDDNSAEIVYTSHTIEHITNNAAQNLFNNANRILKKNGIFRITCPNVDLDISALKNNDILFYEYSKCLNNKYGSLKFNKSSKDCSITDFFLFHIFSMLSPLHPDPNIDKIESTEFWKLFDFNNISISLDRLASKCDLNIQKKFPGDHINWWNFQKIKLMLIEAGFSNIYLSGYQQSQSPVLRDVFYFDNTRPEYSIYVEAIK